MSAPATELRDRIAPRSDAGSPAAKRAPLRPRTARSCRSRGVAIVLSVPACASSARTCRAIGFIKAWGFSFGQALAGLVIVAVALRESIPGRGLSRRAIARRRDRAGDSVRAARCHDVGVGRRAGAGHGLEEGIGCFRVSAISADSGADRGGVSRRARAAAAAGAGRRALWSGLRSDRGRRDAPVLRVSKRSHVVFGHGGAIVGAIAAGVGRWRGSRDD